MTTYSRLGPYQGKVIDAQPLAKDAMELTIQSVDPELGSKKFKYKTGKRSELIRRAMGGDPNVSFSLNERGQITVVTKLRRRG